MRRLPVVPIAAVVLVVVALVSTAYALFALPKHSGGSAAARTAADLQAGSTAVQAGSSGSSSANPGDTSGSPVSGSAADRALVTWLATALPKDAPIFTAAPMAAALRRAGFTAVATGTPPTATGGRRTGTYWLVSSGATGASAAAIATAVPVARFGSGATADEVGLMLAGATPARRDAAIASDRSNRLAADAALAANQAIQTGPTVHRMLRRGGLDLRAASMLALLADAGPVRVRSLPIDPAEAAAGRPARTVVVDSSAAELQQVRAEMPTRYRPISETTTAAGTTLVWPVAVDPVHAVS